MDEVKVGAQKKLNRAQGWRVVFVKRCQDSGLWIFTRATSPSINSQVLEMRPGCGRWNVAKEPGGRPVEFDVDATPTSSVGYERT